MEKNLINIGGAVFSAIMAPIVQPLPFIIRTIMRKNNKKVRCACGCKVKFNQYDERKRIRKYLPGHNCKGANNPSWKGGKVFDKFTGYVRIYIGGGKYKNEQILVIEKHIGRKLMKHEVIHHKNEIKTDNRLCNLEIMNVGDHLKYHRYKKLKKVYQMLDCKIINIFKHQHEVQALTGIKQSNINKVIKGKRKSAGGFQWVS